MDEQGSENWKKIADKLFAQRDEPSEAFVQNVMKRIDAAESGKPRLVRMPAQWFAPAMGIAAMLVLTFLPAKDVLSAEALLMGGETDRASEWISSGGAPETEDVLDMAMWR